MFSDGIACIPALNHLLLFLPFMWSEGLGSIRPVVGPNLKSNL